MIAFALCAMSVFSVVASGCGLSDKIGSTIDQMTCEHVWDKGKETKKATCTEEGEFVKTCTICEKEEVKKLEKIAHSEVKIPAVAPTCTLPGLTEGRECAVCGEVYVKQEEVKARGHKVVTDAAKAPTCTEPGKTEGSHCEDCDVVFVAQETVAATGHSMQEIAAYDATCLTTGYTGGIKCQNCDETQSGEIIAALGHSFIDNICANCGEKEILTFEFTIGEWTYETLPEMTWAEWVESKYNTDGWYLSSGYVVSKPETKDTYHVCLQDGYGNRYTVLSVETLVDYNSYVDSLDVIQPNYVYGVFNKPEK